MALNPEDIVKKSFSPTRVRRGYDESQVDDFLDEVVVELRRLTAESDDLRGRLDDCRASKGLDTAEGEDGADSLRPGATLDEQQLAQVRREREELVGELAGLQEQVDATRAEAEVAEADARVRIEAAKAQVQEADADVRVRLKGDLAALQEQVDAARSEAEQAEREAVAAREQAQQDSVAAQEAAAAREAAAEAMSSSVPADDAHVAAMAAGGAKVTAEEPAAIISLAQRLHDEHVQEGMTTKERLVSEAEQYRDATVEEADQRSRELIESGQSQHDQLVSTGQERHDELVRTGQERHDELVSTGQSQHDQTIREAEAQRSSVLTDLQTKQGEMDMKISELTTFESDYRSRMRAFITEQLGILDRDEDDIPDFEERVDLDLDADAGRIDDDRTDPQR